MIMLLLKRCQLVSIRIKHLLSLTYVIYLAQARARFFIKKPASVS